MGSTCRWHYDRMRTGLGPGHSTSRRLSNPSGRRELSCHTFVRCPFLEELLYSRWDVSRVLTGEEGGGGSVPIPVSLWTEEGSSPLHWVPGFILRDSYVGVRGSC